MQLYKRLSLLATMGIMFIGLTTFSITGTSTASADTGDTQASPTAAAVDITSAPIIATPTPVPNNLEPASKEITKLIKKYLNAKLTCSKDDFKGIVSDVSLIDLEALQSKTEAIREYRNIECYTKRGVGDIDYVAYFVYETVIPTIETPGVSIDFAYITHNKNNKPIIFLGDLESEVFNQLDELTYDDDVQALILDAKQRNDAAMESDEDLRLFVEKLQDIPEGDSEG